MAWQSNQTELKHWSSFLQHRLLRAWTETAFTALAWSPVPYHKRTPVTGSLCCKGRLWKSKPLQKHGINRSEHTPWNRDTKLHVSAWNLSWCYTKLGHLGDNSSLQIWYQLISWLHLISPTQVCPEPFYPTTQSRDHNGINDCVVEEFNTEGWVLTLVKQKATQPPPGPLTDCSTLLHLLIKSKRWQQPS